MLATSTRTFESNHTKIATNVIRREKIKRINAKLRSNESKEFREKREVRTKSKQSDTNKNRPGCWGAKKWAGDWRSEEDIEAVKLQMKSTQMMCELLSNEWERQRVKWGAKCV